MTRLPLIPCVAAFGLLAAPVVLAETPRTDTAGPPITVPANSGESNWPDVPPRQSGASYNAIIKTTFGFRERNFESGRR